MWPHLPRWCASVKPMPLQEEAPSAHEKAISVVVALAALETRPAVDSPRTTSKSLSQRQGLATPPTSPPASQPAHQCTHPLRGVLEHCPPAPLERDGARERPHASENEHAQVVRRLRPPALSEGEPARPRGTGERVGRSAEEEVPPQPLPNGKGRSSLDYGYGAVGWPADMALKRSTCIADAWQ